ncbi:envelope stress response protein PspG [Pseudomonas sp. LS44]|uniref:envelope stress response protein PspG n=1 Tax=Pseudomonas sp. LS44 TaxID=1357074 RepID=UPI00215A5647|nr:envelope stress response protein PspG [Pseudomonas sp. LS44]UVE18503.1 envelope stress response protein PspG [Pseudomonas sp. LS44]
MGRLLFWIVLIAVAVWLWRHFKRPTPPRADTEAGTTPMVRCAQCGVHVPQNRALQHESRWYCSQAHLTQGSSSGDR